MAKATFKVLLKEVPREDETYAVRIRITKSRKHAYLTPGINIKLTEWNPKHTERNANWIRSTNKQHRTYNDNLKDTLHKLWQLDKDHPELTAKELKQRHENPVSDLPQFKGLLAFWQEWIDRKRALGQEGTADHYQSVRKYLLDFTGPDPKDEEMLNPAFAVRWLAWMRAPNTETGKIAFRSSTCNGALDKLRTIHRHAVIEGWVPQSGQTLGDAELEDDAIKRERPAKEVVLQMMDLELKPGTMQHRALLSFLLQFFLHGARVSEALLLEWSQVKKDRIVYKPKKKARKEKSVPLNEGLLWVLERCDKSRRFVLPYMQDDEAELPPALLKKRLASYISRISKGLVIVSKQMQLPFTLTSHMARHAFADSALESVTDLRILQDLLGHRSVQTTENYVENIKQNSMDVVSTSVYGEIFGKENIGKTFTRNRAAKDTKRIGRKSGL